MFGNNSLVNSKGDFLALIAAGSGSYATISDHNLVKLLLEVGCMTLYQIDQGISFLYEH